jgi:hypothetical protein
LPLPSTCLQSVLAFVIEGRHRRAFAIEGPLPSRGLCHRGAFAIKVPLP